MQASAVWLVVVLALAGANLPFVSNRHFLVLPLRAAKSWYLRLGELLAFYLIVGAASLGLEARMGQIYPQQWQFYAVSLALFLVLAFPGYVLRYLVRRAPN
jgi:hypothetical protein